MFPATCDSNLSVNFSASVSSKSFRISPPIPWSLEKYSKNPDVGTNVDPTNGRSIRLWGHNGGTIRGDSFVASLTDAKMTAIRSIHWKSQYMQKVTLPQLKTILFRILEES